MVFMFFPLQKARTVHVSYLVPSRVTLGVGYSTIANTTEKSSFLLTKDPGLMFIIIWVQHSQNTVVELHHKNQL